MGGLVPGGQVGAEGDDREQAGAVIVAAIKGGANIRRQRPAARHGDGGRRHRPRMAGAIIGDRRNAGPVGAHPADDSGQRIGAAQPVPKARFRHNHPPGAVAYRRGKAVGRQIDGRPGARHGGGFVGLTSTDAIGWAVMIVDRAWVENTALDNVSIGTLASAAPEPASRVLLAAGFGGLGLAMRRRSARSQVLA